LTLRLGVCFQAYQMILLIHKLPTLSTVFIDTHHWTSFQTTSTSCFHPSCIVLCTLPIPSSDLRALMHLNLPDFSTLTLKYPLARFFFTTHTNSYDLWRSTGHKSQLTFSCFRPILLPSSMTSAMENQYWVSKIRMFFAKNLPVLKEILHTFWNGGIWQWQKWLNSNFPDHFIVSKLSQLF
jgi:hypothetical protein